MGLTARRLAALVMAAGLAATALVASVTAAGQPRGWIDAPLPGAALPQAPVTVTAHAASGGGVKAVRFLVDGLPAAEVGAPPGDLVTVTWTWQAPSLGEHLVSAVAVGADGLLATPVAVAVTIGAPGAGPEAPPSPAGTEAPGPNAGATSTPGPGSSVRPSAAPTPRPTPPPTPRPTPPPTPPPCQPPPPTLLDPNPDQIIGPDDQNPPTFRWRPNSPDCPVSGYRVNVYNRVIGYDVDFDWDDNTWTPRAPLEPNSRTDCGHYQWSVSSYGPAGLGEPAVSTFRVSPTGTC